MMTSFHRASITSAQFPSGITAVDVLRFHWHRNFMKANMHCRYRPRTAQQIVSTSAWFVHPESPMGKKRALVRRLVRR